LLAIGRVALAATGALATAACSSSAGPPGVSGTPGQPISVTMLSDTLIVGVTVNGVQGTAVVDTGSPIVALDPTGFAGAELPDGAGHVQMTVGALSFADQYVVGAELLTSPDPTIPLGGSMGCGILCGFAVSFNYRDLELTLGAAPVPSGVTDPGTSVPFTLEGGLTGTIGGVPGIVTFPPSRVPVTATVEGKSYSLLVDSGSSFVVLRQAAFTALVADGRGQLSGIGTATQSAQSSSSVARLRSVIVGGAEVDGLVAAQDANIDATLDEVAIETGHAVDGLVGGSFLRNFYVTVDYPGGAVELRPYATGGPTYDIFDRIGLAISPVDGTVSDVFAGTDASAKGVAVGDAIVAIDGKSVAGMGVIALSDLVSGVVGSVKSVEFGAGGGGVAGKTVGIRVDDILPLK
jgi:hypothetical protein